MKNLEKLNGDQTMCNGNPPMFSLYAKYSHVVNDPVTMELVYGIIKYGSYRLSGDLILMTKRIRMAKSKEEKSVLKKELCGVTFAGVFHESRKPEDMSEYSGGVILDFDHVDEVESKIREVFEYKSVWIVFRSPSGDGMKVVLKADIGDSSEYSCAYGYLCQYFKDNFDLEADQAPEVNRLCWLPYDPGVLYRKIPKGCEYQKPNGHIATEHETQVCDDPEGYSFKKPYEVETISPYMINYRTLTRALDVIDKLEKDKCDITSDYRDWLRIAFAFVNEFGEMGRDFFHRVSRFYPGYSEEEADLQYTKCMHSKKSGITIGTFFYLAGGRGGDGAVL
jgi:hypothetical protein